MWATKDYSVEEGPSLVVSMIRDISNYVCIYIKFPKKVTCLLFSFKLPTSGMSSGDLGKLCIHSSHYVNSTVFYFPVLFKHKDSSQSRSDA